MITPEQFTAYHNDPERLDMKAITDKEIERITDQCLREAMPGMELVPVQFDSEKTAKRCAEIYGQHYQVEVDRSTVEIRVPRVPLGKPRETALMEGNRG